MEQAPPPHDSAARTAAVEADESKSSAAKSRVSATSFRLQRATDAPPWLGPESAAVPLRRRPLAVSPPSKNERGSRAWKSMKLKTF